jgi:hypothetical protein
MRERGREERPPTCRGVGEWGREERDWSHAVLGGRRRPKIAATGEERSGYLFKSDVPYFVMREQVSMSLGISVRQYVKISDKRSPE